MPMTQFDLQWPDGSVMKCHSPSTIIRDYLVVGKEYTLADFLECAEKGLGHASERVREKYGFACSMAADQWDLIRIQSDRYQAVPAAKVQILRIK
ncbi:MSMEG_0570 family nitrogen starvation response protein [Limnobacter litoralis]|uniref:MSMEG_0570 family nitrogen starvation response protein n=1 Tax=Limnobacter litoralis TaxID=481366 RepID=A0ABQ5YSK1_9BURK|nr:MSMEG_0570 family nitrogen starvation response protein [Limnobacter litoralis]GLR27473.1 hypothetical protein GCM10007875_25640 [Limnobacter litoralis]